MNLEQFEQYAPYIVIALVFILQNNFFVRPEQLEKKHREISAEMDSKIKELEDDIQNNYVALNAYKEFQNHIYSKLDELTEQNADIKAILMRRRKDD